MQNEDTMISVLRETERELTWSIHYQFAPKGSHHIENMLTTIEHLPNRFNYFTHENYQIYSLDDYAVHLELQVRENLRKRGYILAGIGVG